MIDLYYYTSPNVRKVLIALEELSLEYQIIWTDIKEGDQFAPEYLEINPNGKVPAIVDHDGPGGEPIAIFETGAILQYLAEKTGRLLPTDPRGRQEALCWLFWQVANHGPMAGQAAHFVSHAPKQGIDNPYARSRYVGEVARLYKVLDDRLRDRDYLAGEYSIADISTYTWTRVASGHGITVSDYPNLKAWSDRIAARPAAKVKISDPREEAARKNIYNAEQFQRLFRPEGSPA
ncbi:glutathione S-transferase [Rhodococcus opacus PD630]|jgi:GST-like protein|uniref:glutathione S-transferase family protein n=1 Tax=Rhodococcus TaxID=1827 RepID=UPI00029CC5CA|nr:MULTISPECIES: glutathione S-transferase N-terminal domain-containing protein [Rhodococcus]KXF52681.1 glutathione S-transferase [Rhodococcus sp. SC4]RZK74951.1 MAG: glutathione S-transferase [Rhodococcus sp. (in: high G+C Gram-positive bacteria)]AHK30805.1 putative disulfide bond reductase yfcG [Rhodococcus opacus PD630]EHI47106.1 glutathione S-transferase [Rhodococcus opacus PD630]PBC57764.1 glutathione S-transferase [Rhodococcus sp. ACPA1]